MPRDKAGQGPVPQQDLKSSGHLVGDSCSSFCKGTIPETQLQGNETTLAMPFTLLEKTKPNPSPELARPCASLPLCRFLLLGCHFSTQLHFPSISSALPLCLSLWVFPFLYYNLAPSINRPVVDHANGIINLGNSEENMVHGIFVLGTLGLRKSVNLGVEAGADLALELMTAEVTWGEVTCKLLIFLSHPFHAAPPPQLPLSRPRTSHPPSLAVKAERIRASSCKHTRGYKSTAYHHPPQAPPALEADFPLQLGNTLYVLVQLFKCSMKTLYNAANDMLDLVDRKACFLPSRVGLGYAAP